MQIQLSRMAGPPGLTNPRKSCSSRQATPSLPRRSLPVRLPAAGASRALLPLALLLLLSCSRVGTEPEILVAQAPEETPREQTVTPPVPEEESISDRLPESVAIGGIETAAGSKEPASGRDLPPLPGAIPRHAGDLAGLRIVLDPGHGGDIGEEFERTAFKRGPTGLREAVVNLRTAQVLSQLLRESGAEVILTRSDDIAVSLEERARIASEANGDILLSIHHNASASPESNYASVWYHRDGEAHPASLDIARELQQSLYWWLRHPQVEACGIYSDLLMYEEGFAILRKAPVPAVLAECSFFTNPEEEALLSDLEYNRRVAWALFLGLASWASDGVPRWQIQQYVPAKGTDPGHAIVELSDGMKEKWGSDALRIRWRGLRVVWGDQPATWERLPLNRIRVEEPGFRTRPGSDVLGIWFENRAKNSSVTPPKELAGEPLALNRLSSP